MRKKHGKGIFKLMNNEVFEMTMGNVRKHKQVKIMTVIERRNYLMSEPNYHTIKCF